MYYWLSVATCIGIGICLLQLIYHVVRAINSQHIQALGKQAAKQTSDRIKDVSGAGWEDAAVKMMLTSGAFLGHLNTIAWLAQLNRGKFDSPQAALDEYRRTCSLDNITLEQVHERLNLRQGDFKDDMFHATCTLMKLMDTKKGVKR
jgi:hypothetical protein